MAETALTLKQLRYLVTLADTGHFRRAAEKCGITQPSLSVQLQNLEGILGNRLIERGRSGVTLTPIGREVVVQARRVLLDAQGIIDLAASTAQRLVGTIRLGVKPTLGPYLLPSVVSRLHQQHPSLKLHIRESAAHELEGELLRGTHDLTLVQLPVSSTDIVVERLFREPIYLAVAADHPLASKAEVTSHDLEGLPILTLTPEHHLHDQVHALCEEFGATLMRDYEGTSLDALRQMVAMNMGATFVPALYARSEVGRNEDVVLKTLQGRTISRSIGLAWRAGAGRLSGYGEIAEVMRTVVRERFDDLTTES